MHKGNQIIYKELLIKNKQIETLVRKNTTTELKKSPGKFNKQFDKAETWWT